MLVLVCLRNDMLCDMMVPIVFACALRPYKIIVVEEVLCLLLIEDL